MKRIFTLVCLLACATLTNAQDRVFKPFKVDLSLGYALPSGSGSKAGVVIALEPKYAIQDQISVGLRCEAAVVARGFGDDVSADVKAIGS